MIKIIGYLIFSLFYYIFCIFPIRKDKVFCIMTHDSSESSNVSMVVNGLKEKNHSYQFNYIKKSETNDIKGKKIIVKFFDFFIRKPYEMATSEYIIQDNIFLPIAYIIFRKKVKVIQLWHGTGTIKKFGQSINTGQLGRLEKRANQSITHLIVNSNYTKSIYSQAFGISEDKIFVFGLPRTDRLFDKKRLDKDLQLFYKEYPQLRCKKIILYAPTFRDNEVNGPLLGLNINELLSGLSEDYVLILKLHPHIANKFNLKNMDLVGDQKRVYDFSKYNNLNTLFVASEILVTDYSSIIFDYCILEKPMIFFAYDLEDFSESGRGFYTDYKDYVPGNIAYSTKELITYIRKERYDIDKTIEFKNGNYQYLDGTSTKRIIENIFSDK